MDFQEHFYKVMTRLRANSRAASTSTQISETIDDARVTELINGVLVSKPAKKVTDLSNQEQQESEPEAIDLQEYARSGKAASVTGISKIKAIHDFISSNGRIC
jgi:hypothetical protein